MLITQKKSMKKTSAKLLTLLEDFFNAGYEHGVESNEIGVGSIQTAACSWHCKTPDFDSFLEKENIKKQITEILNEEKSNK